LACKKVFLVFLDFLEKQEIQVFPKILISFQAPWKKKKKFWFGKMSQNVAHRGFVMLTEAHHGS